MSPQCTEIRDADTPQPMRFLRMAEVVERTGLNKRTIQRRIKDGTFPKPVPLGDRAIGFVESEIVEWMEKLVEARQ